MIYRITEVSAAITGITDDKTIDCSYPPIDIVVDGSTVHMFADLPGVQPEDVDIFINGDILVIGGIKNTRSSACPCSDRVFLRVERQNTNFRRIFRLNNPVNAETVRYSFDDGVLHIFWKYI